jgi:hypothetical protein
VGVERVVAGVVAVLRLRAAVAGGRGHRLLTAGEGALLGGGLAHASIILHFIAIGNDYVVKC